MSVSTAVFYFSCIIHEGKNLLLFFMVHKFKVWLIMIMMIISLFRFSHRQYLAMSVDMS